MILSESFEVHDQLNPKLFDSDNRLLPKVRETLLYIVDTFKKHTTIDIPILDAILVGSNASYNYTDKSDIDLHVVTNFSFIDSPIEITTILFNQLKSTFNDKYNIKIYDLDVEIYVEDVAVTVESNGIYSILNDAWIKYPKKISESVKVDVSSALNKWIPKITAALSCNNPEVIRNILNELYMIRKNSIASSGEYGSGNQLFKELRSLGYLDKLKTELDNSISHQLSLEKLTHGDTDNLLDEASRSQLLNQSKSTEDGNKRFKKRVKSKISTSVKSYNNINMDKLFKQGILTIDIDVNGESDTYQVKISFGGFLDILYDDIKRLPDGKDIDLKVITRALITAFNRNDVYIHCTCDDFKYRFDYLATRKQITSGSPQTIASNITNPNDNKGSACKHVLLVLSNTSWLVKCASSIYNYINYMKKHYEKLYADVIYPSIYKKEYEEPVQLSTEDSDTVPSDSNTIDKSNDYAKNKGKFSIGNNKGIKFARGKDKNQLEIQINDSPTNSVEELDDNP